MKLYFSFFFILIFLSFSKAQDGQIKAQLLDNESNPIVFANVLLMGEADSIMVKVETTNEQGVISFLKIPYGNYYLEASYIGFENLIITNLTINEKTKLVDLGKISFIPTSVQLDEALITASRVMVEIKPDRTIFNVEGTINSAGDNGFSLLRKAPGVLIDNNDNISVLSRSGVLIYVDGRRLPLSGTDLTNYLTNLPAEQIDKIEIITNPGAKYEAEGNAGIIDIRLKKDKNIGYNGSLSATGSYGKYGRASFNGSGNYRNKILNTFGTLGYGFGDGYHETNFVNYQNGIVLRENDLRLWNSKDLNLRWGTDFFLTKNQTIGFLISAGDGIRDANSSYRNEIASSNSSSKIDSILIAQNTGLSTAKRSTYNINYAYSTKANSLNIDFDYGRFRNNSENDQPNLYYNPQETEITSKANSAYDTPVEIDIITLKLDYEKEILGGKVGVGSKFSKVTTDNTFLFYDVPLTTEILNPRRSNNFLYDENVYAGYLSYARPISKKLNFSGGLRAEKTIATGDLKAFLVELNEDPVELNYLNFFPSAGLTYQINPENIVSVNYGRRINRPDYNVLNPFRVQVSELSFNKGNPFLRPEIVNNIELGYSLFYRYNFKLSYSKTLDQITRLFGPDEIDPRAGYITWENLTKQTIYSANISAPVDISKWWNMYLNINSAYLNNQADYGEGAVVDVQAFTYSIFQQSTFSLPFGLKGEISGYFSGPGVWGGVFKYRETWSLNLGLQKKFFNEAMNVRISMNDIFLKSGWTGYSEYNGLRAEGMGIHDSRRASLSLSYNFGNSNVKSRKRNTGIEDEAKRVSSGG